MKYLLWLNSVLATSLLVYSASGQLVTRPVLLGYYYVRTYASLIVLCQSASVYVVSEFRLRPGVAASACHQLRVVAGGGACIPGAHPALHAARQEWIISVCVRQMGQSFAALANQREKTLVRFLAPFACRVNGTATPDEVFWLEPSQLPRSSNNAEWRVQKAWRI